ncbi:hypothetical protein [Embleya sp. NPDC020630]|uniref:hypothetical protein n=1 Tax=Embleya sp. NPDC020630 TaxID=3363979 RepID=UPI00379A95DB
MPTHPDGRRHTEFCVCCGDRRARRHRLAVWTLVGVEAVAITTALVLVVVTVITVAGPTRSAAVPWAVVDGLLLTFAGTIERVRRSIRA